MITSFVTISKVESAAEYPSFLWTIKINKKWNKNEINRFNQLFVINDSCCKHWKVKVNACCWIYSPASDGISGLIILYFGVLIKIDCSCPYPVAELSTVNYS